MAFLHGLEEGGLGFGGGAVDFVGDEEGGEDGAGGEGELVALEVKDVGTGDVGGHEVRGELDALEGAAHDGGEGFGEEGFGDAGNAFEEAVLAAEDDDEGLVDGVALTDDDAADFGAGFGEELVHLFEGHRVGFWRRICCIFR